MRRRRDERGASTIELVLYMPLLMIAMIMTIQFALVYLANHAVGAAAREAARTARVTDDPSQGEQSGRTYAANLGGGYLDDVTVEVVRVGATQIRATVRGTAPSIIPLFGLQRVSEDVQGPVERFVEDVP